MQACPAAPGPVGCPEALDDIPPLPATVAPLVRAATDPETTPAQLGELCARDPVVAARVLRLVNSAAYAPPRPVTSVHRAVLMLGTRALSNLALSLAVVDLMKARSGDGGFDSRQFLRRSLRQAAAARLVAERAGDVPPSDAFTAGLCLDVGYLAFMHRDPRAAGAAWSEALGQPAPVGLAIEERRFGRPHADLGARVVEHWGLPAELVDAIHFHHAEDAASRGPLTRVASVAASIAALVEAQDKAAALDHTRAAFQAAGLPDGALDGLLPKLGPEVDELARAFQLDVEEDVRWEDILLSASRGLVQLNLSYEELVRRLEDALAEKARLAEELARANAELTRAALTDALTGLANRRRLFEVLGESPSGPRTLVLTDVDFFKKVNDTHGHDAGDEVLRTIGAVLQAVAADARLVARCGGEEFCLVVEGTAQDARRLAEMCRLAVERTSCRTAVGPLKVTMSFGVAASDPRFATRGEVLLRQADLALYEAKKAGRNRVVVQGAPR